MPAGARKRKMKKNNQKKTPRFSNLYKHYMRPRILEEPEQIITLEKPAVEEEGPRSVCTCGWKTPYSTNLIGLGNAAIQHANETGHRLRNHH